MRKDFANPDVTLGFDHFLVQNLPFHNHHDCLLFQAFIAYGPQYIFSPLLDRGDGMSFLREIRQESTEIVPILSAPLLRVACGSRPPG